MNMTHTSYGIIVYREVDNKEREFLIVKNKKADYWGFPKGTPEVSENEEETARREFEEETGLKAPKEIYGPIAEERYFFTTRDGLKAEKINKFFIGEMKVEEKAGELFADIEEIKWCKAEEALNLFIFEETKETLKNAQKNLG